MPDQIDPLSGPVFRTSAPAPIAGQTVPYGEGVLGAFTAPAAGSLGVSLAVSHMPGGADNSFVTYDDAVKTFKEKGLDPNVLPKGGIYQNSLNAIAEQQTVINNANDAARRSSSAGSTAQWVAGLAGGLTDPLFLALGPIGRAVGEGADVLGLAAKGASLPTRVGLGATTGAIEGGAVMGGYTAGQKELGTAPGNADITSADIVKQTAVGMVFGGAVKGALSTRTLDTGTVATLERSAEYAKKTGIPIDDIVSPTGAIGKHQVEPYTAKAIMGPDFDVSTLHDPKVNEEVAQKILDENAKAFPNDPEAQTIAYNAGPKRAKDWIAAGRNDSVLPKQTQDYLNHYRSIRNENPVAEAAALPPEVKTDALKTAVAQVAEDSDVNVDPVIKNGVAEADASADRLVVARRMPNGEVQYGKPGDMHFDLYNDEELEQKSVGSVGMEQSDMGFAKPGGPFMSREEAAASLGQTGRLESQRNEMTLNGETVPNFGRRVDPATVPPLEEATPKPGSMIQNERLSSEMLARINQAVAEKAPSIAAAGAENNPELADLKAKSAEAEQVAAHAHEMAFGPAKEGTPTAFETHMKDVEDEGNKDSALAKAIDAAVRCGTLKGLD